MIHDAYGLFSYFGDCRSVTAFGARGNATTDDTQAFQDALDWAASFATGRSIYVPPGQYRITDTLEVKKLGTRIFGLDAESTELRWAGAEGKACIGVASTNTTAFTRVRIEELFINFVDNIDGRIGIDASYFSYSTFARCIISLKGNDQVGILLSGTTQGESPYYNVFQQIDMQMDNVVGETSGSVGYLGQNLTLGNGTRRGPNANLFLAGRLSGGDQHVWLQTANGNQFYGIESESCVDNHIRLGRPTATTTGTATSATVATLTDSGASWTTNLFAAGSVRITGGTGSGQVRRIVSNTSTVITVQQNWRTRPDATSTYAIFPSDAMDNDFQGWRLEGGGASVYWRSEPGALANRVWGGMIGSVSGYYAVGAFSFDDRLEAG